jgi:hypothetical protein
MCQLNVLLKLYRNNLVILKGRSKSFELRFLHNFEISVSEVVVKTISECKYILVLISKYSFRKLIKF